MPTPRDRVPFGGAPRGPGIDITGARWSLQGAEAILKLRAIRSNGDFDEYWTYHVARERHRNHQSRYANGVIPRAT